MRCCVTKLFLVSVSILKLLYLNGATYCFQSDYVYLQTIALKLSI